MALGIIGTIGSTFATGNPTTATDQLPEVSIVDVTLTTMVAVQTSIACEPLQAVSAIYIVMNNVTQTIMAKPTGNCGNSTTTIPFTTTERSTRTTIPRTSTPSISDSPFSTSTDASGAQGITVQSGFLLALLGLLMCFV